MSEFIFELVGDQFRPVLPRKDRVADCVHFFTDTQAALNAFHGSDKYKAEKADLDVKAAALAKARQEGTPQERLDASGEYNRARLALDRDDKAALSSDSSITDAARRLEIARSEVAAISLAKKVDAERVDREKLEAEEGPPPIRQAIAAHEVIIGMNIAQVEKALDTKGKQTGANENWSTYEFFVHNAPIGSWGDTGGVMWTVSFRTDDGKVTDFSKYDEPGHSPRPATLSGHGQP